MILTTEDLIERIALRNCEGNIRLAKDYALRGGLYEARTLDCELLGLCQPLDFDAIIKEASRQLVYSDEEMMLKEVLSDTSSMACMDFVAVLTTTKKDRDGDVLESGGAEVDPRAPLLWQHLPQFPIGKLVNVLMQNPSLIKGRLSIADTQQGRDAAVLVEFGALRISHGFKPKKIEAMPPGKGDLWTGYHIIEWKMFEVSLVSVPSNDDAVITAFSRQKLHSPFIKSWANAKFEARPVVAVVELPKDEPPEDLSQAVVKGAVPFKSTPKADEDRAWDASAATDALAKWASSDGSGDKDKMDWGKYAQGFAWVDSDNKENFGSGKMPHHTIIGGKLVVVLKGVQAAMAALNGARGSGPNIPDSDRKKVWRHLAAHLRQFGYKPKDVPPLKAVEDLPVKAIETKTKAACGCTTKEDEMNSAGTKAARVTKARMKAMKETQDMITEACDHAEMQKCTTTKALLKAAHHMIGKAMPTEEPDDEDDDDYDDDDDSSMLEGSDLDGSDLEDDKSADVETKGGNVVPRMTPKRMQRIGAAKMLLMDSHDHDEMQKCEKVKSMIKAAHDKLHGTLPGAGKTPAQSKSADPDVLAVKLLARMAEVSWQGLHDVRDSAAEAIAVRENLAALEIA